MDRAQRLTLPGLKNIARVTESLYRGAQPGRHGFRHLRALGIRTVLSLRSWHRERQPVRAAGMVPVELPLRADVRGSVAPSRSDLERFFAVVLDPERQPVFVHCAHGRDRTGVMIAVYRIEVDGWPVPEALAEMQDFGFHPLYRRLIQFVRSYETQGFARPDQVREKNAQAAR
jgi:tyrosine-protein phosphatase SIW14